MSKADEIAKLMEQIDMKEEVNCERWVAFIKEAAEVINETPDDKAAVNAIQDLFLKYYKV